MTPAADAPSSGSPASRVFVGAVAQRQDRDAAQAVFAVAAAYDKADAFSCPAEPFGVDFSAGPFHFGVPRPQNLNFFSNNFMNLLDYNSVAVRAAAHKDVPLLRLADRFHRAQALSLGGSQRRWPTHPPSARCPRARSAPAR